MNLPREPLTIPVLLRGARKFLIRPLEVAKDTIDLVSVHLASLAITNSLPNMQDVSELRGQGKVGKLGGYLSTRIRSFCVQKSSPTIRWHPACSKLKMGTWGGRRVRVNLSGPPLPPPSIPLPCHAPLSRNLKSLIGEQLLSWVSLEK